jgi:UDP-glucuronate 4-epimerase
LKVLVTGAAGFIGSHLCETLLARGDQVIALDNFNDYYSPARKRANAAAVAGHPLCHPVEIDIRQVAAVNQVMAEHKPEVVAHLAAYPSVRYSIGRARLYAEVNIVGSINLLEAARQSDVEHFVFASTSSVYGRTKQIPFVETDPCNHPLAPYPASKKAIEILGYTYHNLHQINFTVLRFFSVYGPRGRPDMMPFMVTDRVFHQRQISLFDAGQMKRDWTYIEDIIQGTVAALDRPLGYEIINLGRGEAVLMADFVRIIEELVGRKASLITPPAPASEPKITSANIDKAHLLLGYEPRTSVADGLARFWAWYQQEVAGSK